MPEPVKSGRRYMPGLDGLRAIAVLGVIAYHLDLGFAPGGLLGVSVFFTLSGYLITDLLLTPLSTGGRVSLGGFWLGRARRLLPALFLMLVIVTAWVTLFGPAQPPQFREAVAAAALYVNNWQQIFQDVSYFAQFDAPSPLNHLWSLSVEEQFYIVWPLLLLLGAAVFRELRVPSGIRPRLAAATLFAAIASAIAMAVIYQPSLDPSRVYYGTDTRAGELLIGAALAMVWPSRRLGAGISPGARNLLDGAGIAGLLVIALMFWRTNEFSSFLYHGGFLLLSVATALVVAALAHPAARLGRVIGGQPLRWIGVRSYGVYLWTFPIIVLTTPAGEHGTDLVRDLLQVIAIMTVASLSWQFVEEPIRHGALGRIWAWLKANRARGRPIPRPALIVGVCALTSLAVASAGLAGVNSRPETEDDAAVNELEVNLDAAAGEAVADEPATIDEPCTAVAHIGDSTSEGLNSHDYLPNKKQRITSQYARVGATRQRYGISGAMSIIETYEGNPNAYDLARSFIADGFHGCWVLALGTNDTANTYVAPSTTRTERIDRMMSALGDEPVMWVNVKSLETGGPYSGQNMVLWNEALVEACDEYPNMRIFDWASYVRDNWFIEDGIHFTTPGYAARARLIADGLADSFGPEAQTPTDGCVVR
jgi:peptidoglycan/LPS O-acetylase OafA/YrhL